MVVRIMGQEHDQAVAESPGQAQSAQVGLMHAVETAGYENRHLWLAHGSAILPF
jgi:hypothetical protein